MKIFVCEFITGGGLYREALTGGLLKEGRMMRDALLADLAGIDDVEVVCSYDYRLPAPSVQYATIVNEQDDVWQVWRDLITDSDAVWLIAPETSGLLLRLTELVNAQGKLLLGCPPAVVKVASSKLNTYHALLDANIGVIPTYAAHEWLAMEWQDVPDVSWVIKPDDGVGCEDAVYLSRVSEVAAWLEQGRELTHIVQPLRLGTAASLSMLCRDGLAWLLSCNLQKVASQAGCFTFQGSVVNGLSEHWELFDQLAQKIAKSLPGLNGYIGVDLILMIGNQIQLEVLEINPRLTTSYVGLTEATEVNVAEQILNLLHDKRPGSAPFRLAEISRKKIEITL